MLKLHWETESSESESVLISDDGTGYAYIDATSLASIYVPRQGAYSYGSIVRVQYTSCSIHTLDDIRECVEWMWGEDDHH